MSLCQGVILELGHASAMFLFRLSLGSRLTIDRDVPIIFLIFLIFPTITVFTEILAREAVIILVHLIVGNVVGVFVALVQACILEVSLIAFCVNPIIFRVEIHVILERVDVV